MEKTVTFIIFRAFPSVGGNQSEVITTGRELVRRGWKVQIFSADLTRELEPKLEVEDGITLHRFPSFKPRNRVYFSPQLYNAILQLDGGIVHSISIHIPALEAAFASQCNKRVKYIAEPIYDFIAPDFKIKINYILAHHFIGRRIIQIAEKVRCLSAGEKRLIIKYTGVREDKCSVIPLALNERYLETVRNQKYSADLKRDHHNILYVGRLVEHKGVSFLINAFSLLIKNHPELDVHLNVVGDGEAKSRLIELTASLRINDKVNFHGFLPDMEMYEEYKKADLFIMLSRYESFSIALHEALSLNIPAIVTKCEAFKELIYGNYVDSIAYPINIEELSVKIWANLKGQTTLDEFTPVGNEEITEKLIQMYESILNTSK